MRVKASLLMCALLLASVAALVTSCSSSGEKEARLLPGMWSGTALTTLKTYEGSRDDQGNPAYSLKSTIEDQEVELTFVLDLLPPDCVEGTWYRRDRQADGTISSATIPLGVEGTFDEQELELRTDEATSLAAGAIVVMEEAGFSLTLAGSTISGNGFHAETMTETATGEITRMEWSFREILLAPSDAGDSS